MVGNGWTVALLAMCALAFGAGACGGDETAEPLQTCEEGWDELVASVEAGWDDPDVCDADTDCVVENGRLGAFDGCGDVFFSVCGWVVHEDSVEAFRAHVRETAEPICAKTERSSCGPLCPEIDPACVGGRCVDAAARDR